MLIRRSRRASAEVAAALPISSNAEADLYLADGVRTRLGQGFDIGEVIQAGLAWRDITLPFVFEAFADSPSDALAAIRVLDTQIHRAIGGLGRHYTAMASESLREQERRTSLMLHAVQSVSVSLELDEVLQRAASALIQAVDEPHCGIYLLDSSGQILEPRAIVGEDSEVHILPALSGGGT